MARSTFRQNGGRALAATVTLGLVGASHGAHGAFFLWLMNDTGEDSDLATVAVIGQGIALALTATPLLCCVAFLFWFRRAYGNAEALGLRTSHALGWAIGGWFVPVLNLFRPVEIAAEMWRHAGSGRKQAIGVIALWWICYLVGPIAAVIGARMVTGPDPTTGIHMLLVGDVVTITAVVLAIHIVRRLTAAQAAKRSIDQAEVFA